MLLQRPPEPPVRPHLALDDVPHGDRQAGSGIAVGVSEPEGFKSAELTPWGRASHAGELWGLRRVRFAGQEGRGDGGQGHRSGQLEGRMSRSFAELCACGMAGEADLQFGREGQGGVGTRCQHRDVARGRALQHHCPALQQKQVIAAGLAPAMSAVLPQIPL